MSLLLNYRPVLSQPTGIGVYANAILPALQQLPHMLIPGGETGTATGRLSRFFWTQYQLPQLARQSEASLIFTPAPEGYLGRQRIPQVVMVHDLRPISHPELNLQSFYFRSWVPPLLRSCLHVFTNSNFTALEIQKCAQLKDHQITVIPLGFDEQVFRPSPSPGTPTKTNRPYFLHVGQAYPHKNLTRVIKAFAKLSLAYPEIRLVLAGKPHPSESKRLVTLVNSLGLSRSVEFLSYVSPERLPILYQNAIALVFPSLWEGFGLPVLEAMASGTPVITSLGSATSELAADAAMLIDPYSTDQIADAMKAILCQPTMRFELISRGLRRASQYSWDLTMQSTVNTLSSIISAI